MKPLSDFSNTLRLFVEAEGQSPRSQRIQTDIDDSDNTPGPSNAFAGSLTDFATSLTRFKTDFTATLEKANTAFEAGKHTEGQFGVGDKDKEDAADYATTRRSTSAEFNTATQGTRHGEEPVDTRVATTMANAPGAKDTLLPTGKTLGHGGTHSYINTDLQDPNMPVGGAKSLGIQHGSEEEPASQGEIKAQRGRGRRAGPATVKASHELRMKNNLPGAGRR